jgi:hypothetical protein
VSDLLQQLDDAKANVARLEREVARAHCSEVGHDLKHIGGRNAGCLNRDCACSVPVHECSKCGGCDYGDNEEADQVRAQCPNRDHIHIVGIALRLPDGRIVSAREPARHSHVIAMLGKAHESAETIANSEQGFIDDHGRFLNRADALTLARSTGQMKPRQPGHYDGPELYSEDLW